MKSHLCLLVGAHFRPPAKAIIAALPVGTELTLEREPDNPYDPNAVKVLAWAKDIPKSQWEILDFAVMGYGFSLDDILSATSPWHLGYIAAKAPKGTSQAGLSFAEEIAPSGAAHGTLDFTPNGQPLVRISP
jgi:hypothetical protein